ncbi:neurotensin receptor type 1 isoform X1 [Triplophysa rosa]|uniref:Neurotensin receptor type 1 n=1 Tax=Triplophysa rosa TaxID=992332 RepID=A0A9W7WE13_TRIRA|nr:neurotensin receptor type 1 isoform X1 [Triplophysa rosa]KAI7794388.1 putative neurotensin receptor type 1 [Triplophysa rosa]
MNNMEVNGTLPGRNFIDLRILTQNLLSSANRSQQFLDNETIRVAEDDLDVNTDIYSKVLVTVIYVLLFVVGCLGNSITLYTLLTKKSLQNLQSTVHYHLASLAISDLLILILCMPIELYNFIWVHHPWAFGEAVCKGYYFLRDGCSYATAFNIASLSVERFMAICHPFKAKSIMSRSRTKKLISAMWLASFLLATPMLFTMGQRLVENEFICTTIVSSITAKTVLQVNAFLSFVVPMALISALNGVIASQLLRMFRETVQDNRTSIIGGNATILSVTVEPNRAQSLRHGVMVLRAVVIAFVVCWLPYHARRLMYCYVNEWTPALFDFYHYFYMVTNVLFYVSSAINPVLYNLVSSNYRQIFFSTLRYFLLPCRHKKQQRVLTRHSISICSNHTLSTNAIKETIY